MKFNCKHTNLVLSPPIIQLCLRGRQPEQTAIIQSTYITTTTSHWHDCMSPSYVLGNGFCATSVNLFFYVFVFAVERMAYGVRLAPVTHDVMITTHRHIVMNAVETSCCSLVYPKPLVFMYFVIEMQFHADGSFI